MRKIVILALFFFLLTAVFSQNPSFAQSDNWRHKVDDWVLETAVPENRPFAQTNSYPKTEFLVQLHEQADLSGAALLTTKEAKGRFVYEQLTAVANRTQPAVIQELEALGVAFRPYWISNMIWVEGDIYAVQAMALREDVAHLYANPTIKQAVVPPSYQPLGVEGGIWDNIGHVGAKDVWTLGYTGQGVVIGAQDTGYKWDHPALQYAYRGWDGNAADHNYNWHDAWNTAVGACPANSQAPCDDHGHGTHTMGTMVGNNLDPTDADWPSGAAYTIGMAPGAKWIGCRNMTGGNGTPASYTDCYQWFIAPTDLDGLNANPALAPDVINNSWGCPDYEGCNADSLAGVVAAVRAAGIVTVHSAGNEGASCGSVETPGTIYDESFSVASTGENDETSLFSSRGPVTVDGSNRMKPDISAPGENILSATINDSYGLNQGTSMAAPHVAGMVALLISARPYLRGHVDVIEQVIQDTAVQLTTSQGCGTDTPTSVPNNVFGYGRIDVLKAITETPPPLYFYLPFVNKN